MPASLYLEEALKFIQGAVDISTGPALVEPVDTDQQVLFTSVIRFRSVVLDVIDDKCS